MELFAQVSMVTGDLSIDLPISFLAVLSIRGSLGRAHTSIAGNALLQIQMN